MIKTNKTQNIMFTTFKVGSMELKNRFVMAPMTRARADQHGDMPTEDMAKYYAQRASAGLIISEGANVSLQSKGYAGAPGIYTPAQIAAWRKVTDAVHAKGGKIFCQIWHAGRIGSSKVNGMQPLAPSAIVAKNSVTYMYQNGAFAPTPVEMPRAMTLKDIHATIADFKHAAENAIKAGFDGVEIHAANGYLFDQFLRGTTNHRTDEYGGTPENRMRFLLEVTKGVASLIGKHRVGVRVSPSQEQKTFISYKDDKGENILEHLIMLATELQRMDIAYLHLAEPDWADAPLVPEIFRIRLREVFKNPIIVTGNKTPEIGAQLINENHADLIGFGRKFITNPDYPMRVLKSAALNASMGADTVYGGSSHGYTDYPSLPATETSKPAK